MILLLLFVVVPIAELYTIIRVGASIGFLNTLALIIAVGFVGSWLVKREGMRTWVRFNQTLASGQIPAKEMVDGQNPLGWSDEEQQAIQQAARRKARTGGAP